MGVQWATCIMQQFTAKRGRLYVVEDSAWAYEQKLQPETADADNSCTFRVAV